jgi:DNA polymerase I-like protein with 3'-5' exonuclease and polymerase domains
MIPLKIQKANLALFQHITSPLELILEKMKTHGIPVSPDILHFKAREWKLRMADHAEKVYSQIGKSFSFKSYKQVSDILYGKDCADGVRRLGLEPALKWSKEKREMVCSTDQYAMGKLTHYNPNLQVLQDWSAYNRIIHRFNAFVIKLLRYAPCKFCTEKTKVGCTHCAGTQVGDILGHDPRYVTVRNGKWRFHPTLLLLAVSGRPISVDPNILQWPRNDPDWNIDCRDIVAADENKMLVSYDLNKAELFVAGFLFDDPAMLEVVKMGGRAFSAIASEAFGIPEDQCVKGGKFYHTAKTATYAFIFFVQARTLHETLAKQFIWIPEEDCERMLETLRKRFERYRENVMRYVWKCIKERDPYYVVNYQGRRFVSAKSPELEGHKHYRDFIFAKKSKARVDFFELCRKTASFLIQGSATGDNCQADGLYIIDLLDKLTKKEWSWNRFENGNWDLVAPLYLKYDELACEVHKDYVEPVKNIFEVHPGKYEYMDSYLGKKRLEGLQLGTDITIEKQWSVKWPPPENYQQMTKELNSKHYYTSDGIRFKA